MSSNRVTNNQMTSSLLYWLQQLQSHQKTMFDQISSGKRIQQASDDPVAAAQAMRTREAQSKLAAYTKSVADANVLTNVTSASLDSAVSTWGRVNEIAVSASDGTKTAADLKGMSQEIDQLLQNMVQIANTTNQGSYIFGGSVTDQPAFRSETNPNTGLITGVFYNGDGAAKSIKSSDGSPIVLSIAGSNAGNPSVPGTFIDSVSGVNAFDTLIQLRDKLRNNDTAGLSGANGLLAKITTVAANITAAQTRIGGVQEVLDLDSKRITDQNSAVSQSLADLENVDSASAILELNKAQSTYDAAVAAGGRLQQQGLMNFI